MEPEILVGSVSPNGNLEARVEQDGRCAYFYLRELDEPHPFADPTFRLGFKMRACWVRNLLPAPPNLQVEEMKLGLPPLLPRDYCGHPRGASALVEGDLRIVWMEEGDAAALVERDSVLAIIPCSAGPHHALQRDASRVFEA
jgi:hypothetical protein